MADPADVLHAWEEVIRQLRGAASPVTGASEELLHKLMVPVQRQAELLEQVVRRQAELEKDLAARVLAPAGMALDLLEQTSAAMRAQARAFETASASFHQAAELLDLQAALIEQASGSMRDPLAALRSAGARVRRDEGPPEAGA
jgi:hypothetical protein